MALAPEESIAFGLEAQRATITSTFDFHFDSPLHASIRKWDSPCYQMQSYSNARRNDEDPAAGARFDAKALPVSPVRHSVCLFEFGPLSSFPPKKCGGHLVDRASWIDADP
jgi:hypothetical protein